ncbi:MAG: SoxR reducing system RseC family protein [Clostridia bacterium]|nr:SoxR reducing system RseC family protein [Clostridia bacterium]
MRQIGRVIEVHDEYALVEVSRQAACEGCHNAEGCTACIHLGDKRTTAKADNTLGASVGDRVELETPSGTVILYAAGVFLLPLALGAAGYALGTLAGDGAIPYVCSLIGFAAAFGIVWLTLNRRAARRLDVKIVRIIEG